MAKKLKKPRASDQFLLRFPEGMRDRLAKLAAANGRSMNTELISRLEKSMADSENLKTLEIQIAELWTRVDELDSRTVDLSNWCVRLERSA